MDPIQHENLTKYQQKVTVVKMLLRQQNFIPEQRLDFEADWFFGK